MKAVEPIDRRDFDLRSAFEDLERVDGLEVERRAPLAGRNRFGLGGPADLYAEADRPEALAQARRIAEAHEIPIYVLGDGSNVIVADEGYRGLILRYTADEIELVDGDIRVDVGASLQSLVDFSLAARRKGLHTLERIPGWVGGAIYGNAGAYGHSIDESVASVRFLADGGVRSIPGEACEFRYRESVFKRRKEWILLDCTLRLEEADPAPLRAEAARIREIRDQKFPPTMRCAGSIFKNLYFADLPADAQALVPDEAVRAGKVASAFFLERVGAKGMKRGGIHIAPYHANVIYNAGGGTARELRGLVAELKRRVDEEFGIALEEEVQYVGGPAGSGGAPSERDKAK